MSDCGFADDRMILDRVGAEQGELAGDGEVKKMFSGKVSEGVMLC